MTIRTHFLKCFAVRAVEEKLLKEYFHPGYLYAAIVTLLEKRHGVRMPVSMLKRKLKNRPRKVTPVRRCFLSTFTLITCRSFIILNFIYARKGGFPLSRNFYVRTDVNFNWLYVRKLK